MCGVYGLHNLIEHLYDKIHITQGRACMAVNKNTITFSFSNERAM